MKQLPNGVTTLRFLLTVGSTLSVGYGSRGVALILAMLASLSDFIDGKLARFLKAESRLGTFLDPVADKFFVLVLGLQLTLLGEFPVWLFALIALRYLSQLLAIPILIVWKQIPIQIHPRWMTKWASALTDVVLLLTLLSPLVTLPFLSKILQFFWPTVGLFEVVILCRYWPRFVEILKGEADTFD